MAVYKLNAINKYCDMHKDYEFKVISATNPTPNTLYVEGK